MKARSLADVRLGLVGAGVMAEAVLAGMLSGGALTPDRVAGSDPSARRRETLAARGVAAHETNVAAVEGADVVLLCVKPQSLAGVLGELRGRLEPAQLVISIVAGAGTRSIGDALDHQSVVRAMPNTPAQVGEGVTVWFATEAVDAGGRELTRAILAPLGCEIEVTDERQVAMATAVSGSGPSYVFLFAEALIDAAVQVGLPRAVATDLVLRTIRGSGEFAVRSHEHVSALRGMVTSPGGTSAAGLQELERGALRGVVGDAVNAAFERTLELEAIADEELHKA